MKALIYLGAGLLALALGGCSPNETADSAAPVPSKNKQASKPAEKALLMGADRTDEYVPYLQGKRIGMVINQSSTIGDKLSVDALLGMGIKVTKIFGPEHGFRGNASNGTTVGDEIDSKTGLPIISLYGNKRKPSKADMANVDLMIFDLQDVGVRFYTKINTLRDVMESCAENNVELMVLDRPNPHGYLVDGPILDMKLQSGIGQFPTPIAHGMTIGEFAKMINGEGWMTGGPCKLQVIEMANYNHDMPYVLPVKPSPNLNTQQSVMLYPSLCWFEGTILNHGRGTQIPFTILGAPMLKGIYDFSFTPVSIPGMSESPLHMDQMCYGVDLRNYDVEELRKKRQINLSWLIELYQAYPDKEKFFDFTQSPAMGNFDFRSGNTELRQQIIAGVSEAEIRKSWEPGLVAFKAKREKYLLYP